MHWRNVGLTLALLAGLIVLSRARTYDEPMERDAAIFSVIGTELLNGKTLYTDIWDNKPPAIYVSFAAAQLLFHDSRSAIFLLNIFLNTLTMLGCFWAGYLLSHRKAGGLAAALFWTLIGGDPLLHGNLPNIEIFINACLSALFALVLWRPNRFIPGQWVAAGTLTGLACLYNPSSVIPAGALLMTGIFCAPSTISKKAAWAWVLASGLGVGSLVGVWLLLHGGWAPFWDDVVRFNRYYMGRQRDLASVYSHGIAVMLAGWEVARFTWPLGLLGVAAAVHARWQKDLSKWIVWVAYAVGAVLAIPLPGQGFAHYFQLLWPVLAIGAGCAIARMAQFLGRSYGIEAGVVVTLLLLCYQLPFYRLSPEEWSRLKYGDRFIEATRTAEEINQLLLPNEMFYNWGMDGSLYFETHRSPPTGVFLNIPLVEGPQAESLNQRVLRELNVTKPELVVISKYTMSPGKNSRVIMPWILANYRELPGGGDRPNFVLLSRRGGALERRLSVK